MTDTRDIQRRLDNIEKRLDWIDKNDTRGVPGLRLQLAQQATDIVKNTAATERIAASLDSILSARRQQYVSIALALLPVYILLFLTVFRVTPVG